MDESEEDLLDRAWGLEPKSRLCCQAILAQDNRDDRDSEVLDQPRQGKPLKRMTRQIVLDTETTGLSAEDGDRIIELGCVELFNRKLTGNDLHIYFNPERESHEDALKVHGLTTDFLRDKPKFAAMGQEIVEYLRGAELIIHNAAFDVGFLNKEFERAGLDPLHRYASEITDTLAMAKAVYPGQAQFARCTVRSLRRRPLQPYLPRRQARCAAAGRRLHQPHARPGCAADRRRTSEPEQGQVIAVDLRSFQLPVLSASARNWPFTKRCCCSWTRRATGKPCSGKSRPKFVAII